MKSENWVRKRERYVFELIRSIQPIVSITHLVLLRVNLFRRNMIWKKKNKMSDREFSSISFLRQFVLHLIRFILKCWPSNNALLNFALLLFKLKTDYYMLQRVIVKLVKNVFSVCRVRVKEWVIVCRFVFKCDYNKFCLQITTFFWISYSLIK